MAFPDNPRKQMTSHTTQGGKKSSAPWCLTQGEFFSWSQTWQGFRTHEHLSWAPKDMATKTHSPFPTLSSQLSSKQRSSKSRAVHQNKTQRRPPTGIRCKPWSNSSIQHSHKHTSRSDREQCSPRNPEIKLGVNTVWMEMCVFKHKNKGLNEWSVLVTKDTVPSCKAEEGAKHCRQQTDKSPGQTSYSGRPHVLTGGGWQVCRISRTIFPLAQQESRLQMCISNLGSKQGKTKWAAIQPMIYGSLSEIQRQKSAL